MKEKTIAMLSVGSLIAVGVGVMKENPLFNSHNGESDDLLLENVEALSEQGEDSGIYSHYKNESWRRSYVDTKVNTSKDSTGASVSINFSRNCSSVITYCEHSKDANDVCYGSLNGVITDCEGWKESK